MPALRGCLVVAGILLLALGVAALVFGAWPAFLWLGGIGAAFIVGALFERGRYKPAEPGAPGPGWEPTGESFSDPSSGEVVTVYYHPRTGERRYVSR